MRMAGYSNLAYCYPDNGIGKFVKRDDVRAEVIYVQDGNVIVAMFKGAELTKAHLEKRETNLVPFTPIKSKKANLLIKVEREWYEHVQKMRNALFSSIVSGIRKNNQIQGIFFVGHGIGGAYAAISGLLWAMLYEKDTSLFPFGPILPRIPTKIITFGQPRIGNVGFARLLNKFTSTARITHTNDAMPHFPKVTSGKDILSHHELEIWFDFEDCSCLKSDNYNDSVKDKIQNYEVFYCDGFLKNETRNDKGINDENPFPDDPFFPFGIEAGENQVDKMLII
ncbi:hypothetical protein G9A89_015074 [Geosiphon pyriformis]|nr:hypothetical protein G9A89_015074 [Geosiphon pyriformis]